MKKSLEEVKSEYKLSTEEHMKISRRIISIYEAGKTPVKRPKAIFNFAPPGSGKTRLNGYAAQQFVDECEDVIIINSDELKPFHPRIDEIAKLFPEYYTKVTDQESNPWTDTLFDDVLAKGYNVIYEGTGRNKRLIETMRRQMQGYKIIVRCMAVDEMNCLMSIIERYEGQVNEKGWGRLVTLEHFYKAYSTIIDTMVAMEWLEFVDRVEIYCRGEGNSSPVKIYGTNDNANVFPDVRAALIGGRKQDRIKAIEKFQSFNSIIRQLLGNRQLTEEEKKCFKANTTII